MAATIINDAQREKAEPALVLYPLAHMAIEVYNSMLSVMWPLFVARFNLAFSSIGLLTMVFRGSMTLPQIGFAALADRIGSRWIAVCGLVCMAAGMSAVGLAPTVAALALLLALAPLGSAAFHPAGTAHMSRSMPSRRATAVAFFMIGGTIGNALGPLAGAQVYGRFGVQASPVFVPLGLAVALLMLRYIREDGPKQRQRQVTAQQGGAIPVAIYLLMGVAITHAWLETGIQTYLTTLLTEERGETLVKASQALFVYSLAGSAGIFLGGWLADRIPRWRVIALSLVLCVPLYVCLFELGVEWLLPASAFLGFASALGHPVTVALGQEMMPTRTGLASALTMGISWVFGTIGVVLTGFLADRIGLQPALLLNAGLPVIGLACILIVRQIGHTPVAA